VAAGTLNVAATARAADVAVLVVPRFPLECYARDGAVGLLVPGSGSEVSRAGAIAALTKGRVRNSKLGGLAEGPDLIEVARRPAAITIYVSLPPPGSHPNRTRYPVAVVGGGYHGVLTSTSTRIDGLVSIADIAPTAVALHRGERPRIRARTDAGAVERLERLDRRLDRLHGSRLAANVLVFTSGFTLAAFGFVLRSPLLARAAVLAGPLLLLGGLALSAAGEARGGVTWLVLGALSLAAAPLAGPVRGRLLGLALAALLAVYLVVLVAWPDVAALSPLGPHPDGGGRFFGITNRVETLLLVPALLGAALLGATGLVGVGPLALVMVGWSRAGADGGGILVLAAGLGVLALRRGGRTGTPRSLALVVAGVIALGLVLVGVDAVTGGSSHVTSAVGSGPSELFHAWLRRLEISYRSVTSAPLTTVLWLASAAGLLAIARARPRVAALDAFLVAVAVSLLFNDSPNDVARFGVLAAVTLWAWLRVDLTAAGRVH
jgi:hypothetical protein